MSQLDHYNMIFHDITHPSVGNVLYLRVMSRQKLDNINGHFTQWFKLPVNVPHPLGEAID